VRKFQKLLVLPIAASFLALGFSQPAKADSSPVTFSQTFTGGQVPAASILTAWNNFAAALTGTYTQFTFASSNGGTITVSDPTKVQTIADAIRTGYGANERIGSNTWTYTPSYSYEFGNQGWGNCNTGYVVRPSQGNANWGGVGTTCNSATQTITITFGPVIPQLSTPAAPNVTAQSATTIGVSETSTTSNASSYLVNVYASNGTTFIESATVASGSITTPTTLSNLTPSTIYKVTVTAIGDNVNYAKSAESSQTSVTTMAGTSTISLAITAGNNPPKKLGASTITATINTAGTVSFFYNGRPLHCLPLTVVVAGTTVTCVWKPIVTGRVSLSASLAPSSGSYSASTSTPLYVAVGNRTTSR
jgi:hypothetical protein